MYKLVEKKIHFVCCFQLPIYELFSFRHSQYHYIFIRVKASTDSDPYLYFDLHRFDLNFRKLSIFRFASFVPNMVSVLNPSLA